MKFGNGLAVFAVLLKSEDRIQTVKTFMQFFRHAFHWDADTEIYLNYSFWITSHRRAESTTNDASTFV